jgi:drug/metabolite transporter (DMT)-like permease
VDLFALALVVAAAFVHATWNLLAKRAGGGRLFIWSYSAVTAVLYFPLVAWLVYQQTVSWSPLLLTAILVSGVLHLGYSVCLQTGYRKADLSVVYPVARGTGPTLSVIGAIILLGEPATAAVAGGAGLIVAGVLVIGLAGTRTRAHGAIWPGIRWGAFTGTMIACYTIADGYTVRVLSLSPILLDYFGNLVRLAFLTPIALARREELASGWRKNAQVILSVGALVPVSYVLVLFAMTRAPVSVIAPARELSMMVGVLFSWWILKEPNVIRRLSGAALIACGVGLLTLL